MVLGSVGAKARKKLEKSGATWNREEAFNIHLLYLESIHALINQYVLSAFQGDYETAHNSLGLLAAMMSPKVDIGNIDEELDKIEKLFDQAYVRDSNSEIMRYHPNKIKEIKKGCRKCFKELLGMLEGQGMLTFVPKDFRHTMGDFSKS